MSFPAAVVGMSVTATGDIVTGPGVPNVLIGGMPAAVSGDLVAGAIMSGAISVGSMTVLIGGRPAARALALVNGVNNQSGVPVATTIATGVTNVLIGG
jgi:uncharacterized Zn-binding protein involved in type VI secretion